MAAVAAAATETKTSAVAVPGFHVPFRCPLNPAEWTFVELQGEVQNSGKGPSASFAGVELGPFTINEGKATLRIGNHMLTGKQQKLKNPLVITKLAAQKDADSSTTDQVGSKRKRGPHESQLEVVGVVRSKWIFADRPAPIVSITH